jgi:hypothetical protein
LCDDIGWSSINRLQINQMGIATMKTKQFATLLATILFAVAAYAGEKEHHKMDIKIISDDGGDETHMVLDSADMGFKLHDLEIGESRSIVDEEGRSILITRGEENFSINVDGKSIDLPAFGGHEGLHENRQVWVSKGDHMEDMDVDVHVVHDGMSGDNTMVKRVFQPEGVMIISGKEIDGATQDLIRTALESTGHENVSFVGGDDGGPHGIHVIKKVVEVTK